MHHIRAMLDLCFCSSQKTVLGGRGSLSRDTAGGETCRSAPSQQKALRNICTHLSSNYPTYLNNTNTNNANKASRANEHNPSGVAAKSRGSRDSSSSVAINDIIHVCYTFSRGFDALSGDPLMPSLHLIALN